MPLLTWRLRTKAGFQRPRMRLVLSSRTTRAIMFAKPHKHEQQAQGREREQTRVPN